MSIDLDWDKLGSSLSSSLVHILNRQLTSTARPSFIGPVEVTSLDFGSTAPDVELVDLRDIYRDFLEDDEDEDEDCDPVKVTEGAEDDEPFEWVSRRAAGRAAATEELGPAYHHLPPHIRYGRSPSADLFSPTPALHSPGDIWNVGMSSPTLGDFRQTSHPTHLSPTSSRNPLPSTPNSSPPDPIFGVRASSVSQTHDGEIKGSSPQQNEAEPNNYPNLQLHLHINWHSNLRITLTTSLLINYPSPMFMSLPIKLSVTGLLFDGEIAVAYEGQRHRVHLCILDDLDPYGPACRSKRESVSSTPPDLDEDLPSRPSKPLPVGQRLLPSIFIESEIGQADKHVLKNVTRVERFIADVIRKTVEEELVFPNFHTLVMGDQ
jgi:mitochondrial distribution and morphology protein 12